MGARRKQDQGNWVGGNLRTCKCDPRVGTRLVCKKVGSFGQSLKVSIQAGMERRCFGRKKREYNKLTVRREAGYIEEEIRFQRCPEVSWKMKLSREN